MIADKRGCMRRELRSDEHTRFWAHRRDIGKITYQAPPLPLAAGYSNTSPLSLFPATHGPQLKVAFPRSFVLCLKRVRETFCRSFNTGWRLNIVLWLVMILRCPSKTENRSSVKMCLVRMLWLTFLGRCHENIQRCECKNLKISRSMGDERCTHNLTHELTKLSGAWCDVGPTSIGCCSPT